MSQQRFSRSVFASCAAAFIALFSAPDAPAQAFPERPVTMVVSVGPGGGTDLMARELSKRLTDLWNRPVVVENRPGGAGSVAVKSLMRVPADGYTLLFTHDGIITATPQLFKSPGYDPRTDLIGVSEVAKTGYMLVVNPKVPAKTLPELIALMKDKAARKETFAFATSALGSADHLSGEMFRMVAGVEMLVVPYKGTGPAMADVMGGHLPFGFFTIPSTVPQVKAGNLRAIGVSSLERSPLAPDVPVIADTLPGFESNTWYGVFALAGTPTALVEKVSEDIRKIVATPEFNDYAVRNGFVKAGSTPKEFAAFIAKDTARVGDIIRGANVKVD